MRFLVLERSEGNFSFATAPNLERDFSYGSRVTSGS
jgi:hypothetical protein